MIHIPVANGLVEGIGMSKHIEVTQREKQEVVC
jgi:hypothetical protein